MTTAWSKAKRSGEPVGRCEPCGKLTYVSRKAARRGRHRFGAPGAELAAYRCPHDPDAWHNGHLRAWFRTDRARKEAR